MSIFHDVLIDNFSWKYKYWKWWFYFREDASDTASRWHVFVTGHSLGGALATLLALELCSSAMAK